MTDSVARRPFCNAWPWPNSDLDLVTEEQNNQVHQARGCCDGWWPEGPVTRTIAAGDPDEPKVPSPNIGGHLSDLTDEEASDV